MNIASIWQIDLECPMSIIWRYLSQQIWLDTQMGCYISSVRSGKGERLWMKQKIMVSLRQINVNY